MLFWGNSGTGIRMSGILIEPGGLRCILVASKAAHPPESGRTPADRRKSSRCLTFPLALPSPVRAVGVPRVRPTAWPMRVSARGNLASYAEQVHITPFEGAMAGFGLKFVFDLFAEHYRKGREKRARLWESRRECAQDLLTAADRLTRCQLDASIASIALSGAKSSKDQENYEHHRLELMDAHGRQPQHLKMRRGRRSPFGCGCRRCQS